MPKKAIISNLEELRSQLSSLSGDASEIKAKADQLILALEKHLSEEKQGELNNDLESFIQEYEVEHPQLTGILNRIASLLASMGI